MTRKKKYYYNFWNFDVNKFFRSFEEEMQGIKESDLSEYQPDGPITFGYSVRVGPDTNYQPEVRQWGNLNKFRKRQGFPEIQVPIGKFFNPQLSMGSAESQNRYVDFIEEDETLRIIMEVPGLSKEDLIIDIDKKGTEITVQSVEDQQVKQVVPLPVRIEPNSPTTTLKNGILEIIGKKAVPGQSSTNEIKIEID